MCSLGPYADKPLPTQPATSPGTSQGHLLSVSLTSRGKKEWEESGMERGKEENDSSDKGIPESPRTPLSPGFLRSLPLL